MPRRRIISSAAIPTQAMSDEPPRLEFNSGEKVKLAGKILLVLLLAAAIIFTFAIFRYWAVAKNIDKIGENIKQNEQNTSNSKVLIGKVGRLILLPKNEVPSIATINNVALLQKQSSFYKNARNGDILLIYFQEKKAFIYDGVEDVIVNVGPVVMEKQLTDTPVAGNVTTTSASSTISTTSTP